MAFWGGILNFLDTKMETPVIYGWFHIVFFVLSVVIAVVLSIRCKNPGEGFMRKLLLTVAVVSLALEVYKQINYSFTYDGQTIHFDYQWYSFPFQFCSTPMYVCLLAGCLKKGKLRDALCAYLATFALFAGLCVMIYPGQVFIDTVGINIQTMICHGAMVTLGIYLLCSGYVKIEHRTLWKALPVFMVLLTMAAVMNEIAHASGLLERETFNMFFISPYCEPSLPVYSLVQERVAYPWCTLIYIVGFSLAAYIMLLIPMAFRRLKKKP